MTTVVSLTTTASRIDLCRQACLSLARQDVRADGIRLFVSREPHLLDPGIDDPRRLDWAAGIPGLQVEWVENTGPYRKLLPAIDPARPGDIIVTADDDVLYGPAWLRTLLEAAQSRPDVVVCGRARRPANNLLGRRLGYWSWPFVRGGTVEVGLVPVGISGVLYRPELLDMEWLRDRDYLRLAPTTDDLWFSESARRLGTPVLVAPGVEFQITELAHPVTLFELNGGGTDRWRTFASRTHRRIKSRLGIPCCINDANFRGIRVRSDTLGPPRRPNPS